jgi:two-component system, NarL family, nitrate/nitrite response regulator NarL
VDRASDGRPRIVVAAEHALFGDGLRTLLKSSRRFVVVHSTSDGHEALRRTRELKPDVLVLDLAAFPDGVIPPGVASSLAPTALVVLTTAPHRSAIEGFLELGARGVILKDAHAGLLLRAIRAVVAGEYWVDREPVTDFPEALYRLGTRTRQRTFGLTDRESEIVGAVASAYSNKEIAQLFDISETTVKHHLTNIFDKVGVSTRLELAMFAVSNGFQTDAAVVPSLMH